jgi:D-inositol-3-phosphate glycosyltransferase
MLSIHSSPIGKLGTKDTGGMSVYICELARELGRRGLQIDIFTHQPAPDAKPVIDLYENVRIIHLRIGQDGPLPKLALYPILADFFKALEAYRTSQGLHYDLIHSHYWLSGRLGMWAQEHWQIPHIITFHTVAAVKDIAGVDAPEPEVRIATEKQLAMSCHRILAPTEKEKENLLRYCGAVPEKIGLVPCGVNLDLFRPKNRERARTKLGFDPDTPLLLFVGRFDPMKGIDRLLEAMTYLQNLPRPRLVIIGGDGNRAPETRRLRHFVQKLGIENTVDFIGRIKQGDLPFYYSAADLLVLPSYYESFGLVALEALSCGTPVIATRVGAMENILRKGVNGHVVTDGSPRSLANDIHAFFIAGHRPSADRVRRSVREFSWSNVASTLLEQYTQAFKALSDDALQNPSLS